MSVYIKNIVFVMIFNVFVEVLMPNNNFKKYMNMVIGFIVILIVLEPIRENFSASDKFDLEVFAIQSQIENNSFVQQKEFYEEKQEQLIIDTYTENIKQQINQIIEKSSDVEIESINLELDEYNIKSIEVYGYEKKGEVINNQINIEKILIGKKTAEVSNIEDKNYKIQENLKNLISDFYNIETDNIHIIVRNIEE